MIKFGKGALLAVAVSLALHGIASAQGFPGINPDELKCQQKTAKEGTKFTQKKAKCIDKCVKAAAAVSGPVAPCLAPYTDTATNTCINDPLKGVEPKSAAALVKACTVDAPEDAPYGGNAVAFAPTWVATLEGQVDPFGYIVACEDPNKAEAACMSAVTKGLVKLVKARQKCFDTCVKNAYKGIGNVATCVPAPPTDGTTLACLAAADVKAGTDLLKKCDPLVNPANDAPECYVPDINTWVINTITLAGNATDGNQGPVYCDSPSGSFLD